MINFIDNYSFQSGGGIYLESCDMNLYSTYGKQDSKSLFKNNTALLGGAIRFINLNNSFLKNPVLENIPYVLENNIGRICINNFGSTATKYQFKPLNIDQQLKSGIVSNYSFSLYDQDNNNCTLNKILNSDSISRLLQADSNQVVNEIQKYQI